MVLNFEPIFEYALWYIWAIVSVHFNFLAQYLSSPLVDINDIIGTEENYKSFLNLFKLVKILFIFGGMMFGLKKHLAQNKQR